MADKKFLDVNGVSRLWNNVVKVITAKVDAEAQRARAEESRIEELILAGGGTAAEVVEGEGIDIEIAENGQRVISLEKNSINDNHIESISISKVTLKDGDTLILNGGNANG